MTLDALGREGDHVGIVGRGAELQGPVRPSGIVVPGVLGEDVQGVLLVVDQHAVGALGADAADESLGVGVHLRRLRRGLEDLDVLAGEDGVEGLGVAAVAVTQEVPEAAGAIVEVGQEVSGELGGPGRGRVSGDAEDVYGAGADLPPRPRRRTA